VDEPLGNYWENNINMDIRQFLNMRTEFSWLWRWF